MYARQLWAHRVSPENEQFLPSTKMTEPGNAPRVEEDDAENANINENGNVTVKTLLTPTGTPTHDDPCVVPRGA